MENRPISEHWATLTPRSSATVHRRHILFFLFLMQFRLCRAAAFVSSPIHLLSVVEEGWMTVNWPNVTKVPLREKACNRAASLSWQASPYLYPCSVQYYLIVASIICQMYRHIGVMTSPVSHGVSASERLSDVVTSREDPTSTAVDCDKVVHLHNVVYIQLTLQSCDRSHAVCPSVVTLSLMPCINDTISEKATTMNGHADTK